MQESQLKIWFIALMLLVLLGCASSAPTNYYHAIVECRQLTPEEGACAVEYAAYEKHQDVIERRAAKQKPKCPSGSSYYCYRQVCGCADNADIRDMLRNLGFD